MVILFTDFGSSDLYVGQVKAVLAQSSPGITVIDLLHDVPNFQVGAGAHLLAAMSDRFPKGNVFMAVVDPGVGSSRQPVVMAVDGQFFIGPDNGLLSVVAARTSQRNFWRIDWRPETLSQSFHGRDLFAPIAAAVASGTFPHDKLTSIDQLNVQLDAEDLFEVIYIDHYGNAMTGLRVAALSYDAKLSVNGLSLQYVRTFSESPEGDMFWYENSLGLVEIAVNCGSAALKLELVVGQAIAVV